MQNLLASAEDIKTISDAIQKYGIITVIAAVLIILALITLGIILKIALSNTSSLNKQLEAQQNTVDSLIKALKSSESERAHQCTPEDHASIEFMNSYSKVMEGLKTSCNEVYDNIKADRVLIDVFHNGSKAFNGLPFLKATCISQWMRSSMIGKRHNPEKDIPLNFFSRELSEYNEKGYSCEKNIDLLRETDPYVHRWFTTDRVMSYVSVPLYNNGNLVGLVRAEFFTIIESDSKVEEYRKELDLLSERASSLLSIIGYKNLIDHEGVIKS